MIFSSFVYTTIGIILPAHLIHPRIKPFHDTIRAPGVREQNRGPSKIPSHDDLISRDKVHNYINFPKN